MDLNTLLLKKYNLEYAILEKELQYSSIDTRKNINKSKIIMRFILLIPLSLIFIFSVYCIITYRNALIFLIMGITACATGFGCVTGWKSQIRLLNTFIGKKEQSQLHGARNFKDEKQQAEADINALKNELNRLKEELDLYYSETFVKSASLDDDLYCYGLGTYNEDYSTINMKRSLGAYEREKNELEISIEKKENQLRALKYKKSDIKCAYEKARDKAFILACVLGFVVALTFVINETSEMYLAVTLSGAAIFSIILFYGYRTLKEPVILYHLEYNTGHFKDYKDRILYKTTKEQLKEISDTIDNDKKRLIYVEKILSLP